MSLEQRKVGKATYINGYRRDGSKVIKTHIGSVNDPVAMIAFRMERLRLAEQASGLYRLGNETTRNMATERNMDLLAAASATRKVLSTFLSSEIRLPHRTHTVNPNDSNERKFDYDDLALGVSSIPKPHALTDLRRKAATGEEDAIVELDRLCRLAPDLVASLVSLVDATKQMVVEQLAGDDQLTLRSTTLQLEGRLKEIMNLADDNPLSRMVTEVAAIAWLDAARCSILAARTYERRGDAIHFQKLADRATRRFSKLLSGLPV